MADLILSQKTAGIPMLETFDSRNSHALKVAGWVAWGGCAVVAAYILGTATFYDAFSRFSRYDDEGYMLRCVQAFLQGKRLYNDVESPYGPAYYVVRWFLHRVVGCPLTNAGVRWTGLGILIASAACAGYGVFLMTNQRWWSLAAFLATGRLLFPTIGNEPGHPQELVGLLLALTPVGLGLWIRGYDVVGALIVGGVVGGLLCTKINVGGLLLLALLGGAIAARGSGRAWGIAPWIALACVPLVLMNSVLQDPAHSVFPWLLVLTLLALSAATWRGIPFASGETLWPGKWPGAFVALATGLLSISLIAIGFAMSHGTTLSGLWEALVVVPTRFVGGFGWGLGLNVAFMVNGLLALISVFSLTGPRVSDKAAGGVLFCLRWALVLVLLTRSQALYIALPWIWVLLVSPVSLESQPRAQIGRLLLAAAAVLQELQVFPVPGSQQAYGHLLLAVGICIIGADATAELANRLRWRASAGLIPIAACAALGALLITHASNAARHYHNGVPVHISGMERIRLPESQCALYEFLTTQLRASKATFICEAGLNSLYLWTGRPAPGDAVIGNSLALIPESRQIETLNALSAAECPLVLSFRPGWEYFGPSRQGILLRTVQANYRPVAAFQEFFLFVPKTSPSLKLLDCAAWDPNYSGGQSWLLDISSLQPHDVVTKMEIVDAAAGRVLANTENETLQVETRSGSRVALPLNSEFRGWLRIVPALSPAEGNIYLLRLYGRDGQHLRTIPGLQSMERALSPPQ